MDRYVGTGQIGSIPNRQERLFGWQMALNRIPVYVMPPHCSRASLKKAWPFSHRKQWRKKQMPPGVFSEHQDFRFGKDHPVVFAQ
jgi:hypothetical protein